MSNGMAGVDRVQQRTGGRSADIRARVLRALREALEAGETDILTVDELARRSGVHKTTIYRRWLSTSGAIADLLVELTPLQTPLPDTGDLRRDLTGVATRVARTLETPMSRAMLREIAGTSDDALRQAAAGYWSSLFERTAQVVVRAQQRGVSTTEVDPVDAIESLLGPLYLRALVTHRPTGTRFVASLVDRTVRLLRP
jgi:AcrR family transcriptional regulator